MENEHDPNKNNVDQKSSKNEEEQPNKVNYFDFIIQTIKNPDTILAKQHKGYHSYGIINICVFIAVLLISSIIGRIMLYSNTRWYFFHDLFNLLDRTLAYGITLIILIALFNWYASKENNKYQITFFIEKLGALIIVPAILLFLSMLLELLRIDIYTWFSSIAFTFLYISIFLVSYLFVAKNNLRVASIFVFSFYFIYRLLLMII